MSYSELDPNQQRYERLLESLDEYLCCDCKDCGPEYLISDLLKACEELKEFPTKQLANIQEIQSRLHPFN